MGGRDKEKIETQYEDIKKDWGKDIYLDYLKIKCFKGRTDYDFRENVQHQIGLVRKNIENASSDKIKPDWIKEQFEILFNISGVNVATASVILHFLDHKHFAIIDTNAFAAYQDEIGSKEKLSSNKSKNVNQYIQYNQYIREKAKREKRTLRDVEFELFKKR